jgi:hypothetical protein
VKTSDTKKKSKIIKTREDLIDRLRQLDRLRWEFLRLSDTYRKDWQKYINEYIFDNDLDIKIVCENCELQFQGQCADCEKMEALKKNPLPYLPINSVLKKWEMESYYKSLSSASTDVLMKYGIRFFANPSLSYEEVMAELIEYPDDADFALTDFINFDAFITKLLVSDDALSVHIQEALPPQLLASMKVYYQPKNKRGMTTKRKRQSKQDIEHEKASLQQNILSTLNSILAQQIIEENFRVRVFDKIWKLCKGYALNMNIKHINRAAFEETYAEFLTGRQSNSLKRWNDRYIFYTYLHEYSVYEGAYPSIASDDSPFITLTINVTASSEYIANECRKLISAKSYLFNKKHNRNLEKRRWSLPGNVHLSPLEKVLEIYRMNKHGMGKQEISETMFRGKYGKDYQQLLDDSLATTSNAKKIGYEKNAFQDWESKFDKFLNLVGDYLNKADKIMLGVEQGVFPDI